MTRSPDPIDDVRAELARIPTPTAPELDAQRARFDAALRTSDAPRRTPRRTLRRWLPASGAAVATLAVGILVAVALQPGGDGDRSDRSPSRERGLQLVTGAPGGAFQGLDLESASAAEVLRAAGRAAADGVPEPGPDDWTFVRMESSSSDFPGTTMERWTSPDGERSLHVSTVKITDPDHGRVGRSYSLHYEYLGRGILGDVQWTERADGSRERRAHWHQDAGDGAGDIERMVKLTRLLRDARHSDDVRDALDASVAGAGLEFRDGMACGTDPRYSSCGSSGFVPQAKGLSEEEGRRLYLTGQLLTVTVSSVFPPEATKAIYDYLAALPEAAVAPAKDGSGEVILSLRVKGPSYTTRRVDNGRQRPYYETRPIPGTTHNTKAVAAIDASTGRLVQLNPEPDMMDMTTRYTQFGVAPGPGVGSELCDDFAPPCEEARDLEERLETDPDAQFEGVVDWMFISQFCDGMINRDGTPRQGDHTPRSMSEDPKVKAEREACERREAAAAQGD